MLIYKIPFKDKLGKTIGILGTSILTENNQLQLHNTISEYNHHICHKENFKLSNKCVSKREKECLYYLIRGMTAKEIGRALNLSPRTIEFYIENMKKKFSCHNRIDLIAKAYDIVEKTG